MVQEYIIGRNFMRAKRIIILICILSCVGFGIYIVTGFYNFQYNSDLNVQTAREQSG